MTATDEAIILVGGLGTRLRSVVDDRPKVLAPVAGRPFLARILDLLADHGLRRVVLATGYRAEQIEAAIGDRWGSMEIAYSHESVPLGTGGAMVRALRLVAHDACFALNGDTWLDLDYGKFAHAVADAGARLGMALAQVPDAARYGAARLDSDRVVAVSEKSAAGPSYINAGVYWIRRDVLDGYHLDDAFSFERDTLPRTIAREPVIGYTQTRGFIDIGVPADYHRAQTLFGQTSGRTR